MKVVVDVAVAEDRIMQHCTTEHSTFDPML
jgi:hypothetical protein